MSAGQKDFAVRLVKNVYAGYTFGVPLPVPNVDALHATLALLASVMGALWVRAASQARRDGQARLKAEKALRELRERPETAEFRIERFDLLWFPVVTASVQEMMITAVNPGVPHCGKCAVPLGIDGKEWACARCGARHPETLSDTMVLDTISQLAVKYFQERRPGYRVAIKGFKP